MARRRQLLICTASAALLGGCTEISFAQDAHVVTAGTLADDGAAHDDYRWIDRARALWDAVGDSPPDYGFAFDGGNPVAWELRDGYWVVVEERAEGARSYFFAPGERGPFLIRETDRSFAYQDGHVAAVYDGGGTLLPRYLAARSLDEGEALFRRGRRVRDALLDRQWEPVDTGSWVNLNLFFVGIDQRWDSGWRYRNDGFALAEQQRWAQERARRAAMAAAFARWRNGGFQGAPPPGLGGRWEHRPRPGRPPVAGQPGRPPVQPQPGAGRPDRPWMWGGLPGGAGSVRPGRPSSGDVRPGQGPGAIPTPNGTPGTGLPPVGGRPGWQGERPGNAGRPRPPRGDGEGVRPQRPDGESPPTAEAPRPPAEGTRPGWQGARPEGGAPRPGWTRPGWSGGDRPDRPDRPQRPAEPASPPVAAPAAPPAQPAPPPPARESGERRGGGWMSPGWVRQARPDGSGGDAPRPSFRPPAARAEGEPAPRRPSFTPPPPPAQQVAPPPPPAPRPAPPPPEHREPSPLLREKLEANSGGDRR
ncbi:hypothetical protein [Sphingomonas sp. R1]|uniref:hypothetical protein n=1 Tax=Sphingomonas sp. R1 TaxID=399176 RepID=UPI0022240731|nr:hypothetical protein [Sphingomonas sp. R1]UYY79077.1 hypothetical protein OIM94_08895 [Sphingomonas sp. R1]